jgi:hypothetical protein
METTDGSSSRVVRAGALPYGSASPPEARLGVHTEMALPVNQYVRTYATVFLSTEKMMRPEEGCRLKKESGQQAANFPLPPSRC